VKKLTPARLRDAAKRIASGETHFMCWAVARACGLPSHSPPQEFSAMLEQDDVLGDGISMKHLHPRSKSNTYGSDEERQAVRVQYLLFAAARMEAA
jgi:hypothetical protein